MNRRVVRRALLALILVTAIAWVARSSDEGTPTVYLVEVRGMIHGGVTGKIELALDQAYRAGAAALVIRMDTPGGLLDSTRDIVQKVLNAPLPVIVYVAPSGAHAGSAGVMITLASHVAAMAPGTNIGAATPVSPQGEIPEDMKKKVTNDTAAFVEAIAQQRKRNTEWAIKAVRDAESVTDQKALELGVIDLVAPDLDDLLHRADGRVVSVAGKDVKLRTAGARVVDVQIGLKDRIQIKIANPSVAFVLLLVTILGFYIELSHPGLILPGAVGAIAAILFLFSIQVLPINVLGLLLIATAIALFALEMKFTSYGLLMVGGLACFAAGSLLLFDVPQKVFDPRSVSLRVPLELVLPATITIGGFIALVMYLIVRTHRRRVLTANEGMIGEVGEVRVPPEGTRAGQVFLHGELWRAVSDQALARGDRVRVVQCENLTVKVEKLS